MLDKKRWEKVVTLALFLIIQKLVFMSVNMIVVAGLYAKLNFKQSVLTNMDIASAFLAHDKISE